jgi:hypothetical protein
MLRKHLIALASSLLFMSSNASAWTLIYANDASGTATAGSISALRNAASNGSGIKVVAFSGQTNIQFRCNYINVRLTDATPNVVCQPDSALALDTSPGATFGAPSSPPRINYLLINSLGQYVIKKVNLGSTTVDTESYNFAMQWYVE